MFGRLSKKKESLEYDKARKKPVIHISICTGEQVAGFRDMKTGKFEDVMLITNEKDLKQFRELYGIKEAELTKEW